MRLTRRQWILATTGWASVLRSQAQWLGERPWQAPQITVVNPRLRVPVSFIIDDSTCLVNLNRFAIPQFAEAWGYQRYHQDWRSMPVEIPDSFVRKFGEWCAEQGVKGKYSVVPYPACVGRLDRLLPGWTSKELEASIELVRKLMVPHWDIHPEMVTHTRVIDLKTGHPYPEVNPRYMENWRWTEGKSVDEIAAYIAYALRILRNIGLPCEGITTPGGFGYGALAQLAQATFQACRDVYGTEIPHYFRNVISEGEASVAPRVEYARNITGTDPECVVSIIGCTGDWTGNWDATQKPEPDRYITPDLQRGRLVEVIERGEPAVLVSHWTGIYYNGQELGFQAFQEVVRRLRERYGWRIQWMKLSEIARYWAAKELTTIEVDGVRVRFHAPYACPQFTFRVDGPAPSAQPVFYANGRPRPLSRVEREEALGSWNYLVQRDHWVVCVDLPKGPSAMSLPGPAKA